MKIIEIYLVGLLSLLLIECDGTKEKAIDEKDVPKQVLNSFREAYPGAELREFSEESDDGRKTFEISCTVGDRSLDLSYTPEGKIVTLEETIPQGSLPEPVREKLTQRLVDYQIERAEKLTKDGEVSYEVRLVHDPDDEETYELVFSSEGKLLKEEVNREDED